MADAPMLLSIFYDPLPTPAGRSGRASILTGLIGWGILSVAAGFWGTCLAVESGGDLNLATSLRVLAGWVAGLCVICYFLGVMLAASGVTKLMNGVPDPGFRSVALGFAVNGLPMLLVAAAAAYDKYGRKYLD